MKDKYKKFYMMFDKRFKNLILCSNLNSDRRMKIEIYGKKWCSYCYKVKQLCKREKLDFLYKELNKDFTKQEFFDQFPGAKTFPQIIVDGKKIGGYSELAIQLGKTPNNTGDWIGVGTAIGAAVFAATNEPVWIAVGVAVGAALGWQKPED